MRLTSVLLNIYLLGIEYVCVSSAAKILGLFPMPSISHQVVFNAITSELATRNHTLTVVTTNPVKNLTFSEEKYKQVDIHDAGYRRLQNQWARVIEHDGAHYLSPQHHLLMKEVGRLVCDDVLSSSAFGELMNNPSDLASYEVFLLESHVLAIYGLAWRLKIPYIGISTMPGVLHNMIAVGNPTHPALYIDILSVKIEKIDIWDRIISFWIYARTLCVDYHTRESELQLGRKHFGGDVPPLTTIETAMDLFFINVNPLYDGIRPVVPSTIYLGGLHFKDKKKLPEDLQSFLDESPQGVIYMSLGSNVKSKDLPPGTLQMLTELFGELPYRVLWKYEQELPDAPKNLKISKWLPQQDLLGHPNIKAFITQGGQQSMEEAIRDRVPLVGVPFITDQYINVQKFVKLEIGVALDIKTVTKEQFKNAIINVSTNQKYREGMKRLSALLADQPMSGAQRAVWWTEYVARHGGARHLRSPAAGATLVQYYMLDVVAFVTSIIIVSVYILFFFVRFITRKFMMWIRKQSRDRLVKKHT